MGWGFDYGLTQIDDTSNQISHASKSFQYTCADSLLKGYLQVSAKMSRFRKYKYVSVLLSALNF